MSVVFRAFFCALLCCAALPEAGRAQSVLVRHLVVAEVVPVVGVRDSTWGVGRAAANGIQVTWSGEIRGNTAAEVQVMGPSDPDRTVYARTDGGPWVALEPGTWSTVTVTAAGRRVVTVEVLVTPTAAELHPLPALRVIAR